MEGTQTMTTNPTPLQERIARALMTHECDQHEDQDECMTCDSSMVTCSHPPFMYCVEHDTTVDVGESCPVALERAAAVLPIVAVEVRKAKAGAWQEGVNFALPNAETTWYPQHNPYRATHYPEETP